MIKRLLKFIDNFKRPQIAPDNKTEFIDTIKLASLQRRAYLLPRLARQDDRSISLGMQLLRDRHCESKLFIKLAPMSPEKEAIIRRIVPFHGRLIAMT